MATDKVLISFDVDNTGLQPTIDFLQKIGAVDKQTADQFVQANAQRTASAEKVTQALKDQSEHTDKAASSTKQLGDEGVKAHQKLQSETKNTSDGFDKLLGSIKGVAAAIGIGFGLSEIVRFGEESIKAFAKAELATSRLTFAVNKIIGGNSDGLKGLIEQSERISRATFFTPAQIQEAQTLAVQFGLTSEQTKELTALIPDLAIALHTDLAGATGVALRAIEGQSRGLKVVGADFKDTGSKVENFNTLIDKISKFQGAAKDALNTTSGAIQNQQKEYDLLSEKIGKEIAPAFIGLKKILLETGETIFTIAGGAASIATKLGELFGERAAGSKKNIAAKKEEVKETEKDEEDIRRLTIIQLQTEIDSYKKRTDAATIFVQDAVKRREEEIAKLQKLDEEAAKKRLATQEENSKKLADLRIQSEEKASIAKNEEDPVKKLDAEYDAALKNAERIFQLSKKSAEDRANLAATEASIEIEFENRIGDETAKIKKKEADDNEKLFKEAVADAEKSAAEINKSEKVAADDRKKIREQELKDKNEIAKIEKQIGEDVAKTALDIYKGRVRDEADAAISKLEEQKNTELENANLTSAQRKAIELRYRKEEGKIKHDAAVKERAAAIIEAQVNGLIAVTKILATSPNPLVTPFLIAAAIATDALQVAAITAKPLPQYAKGTMYVDGPGTTTSDSIMAMISRGESIFDAETTERYRPVLSAIHNKKISPDFAKAMLIDIPQMKLPALPQLTDKDLLNMLTVHNSGVNIDYDKLGAAVAKHIIKASDETNFRNRNNNKSLKIDNIGELVSAMTTYNPRRR